MRKITLLLSLLLAFAATAQVTEPQVTTATAKTLYKLKSNSYSNSFITAQVGNADVPFKGATSGDAALFTFEATGEDGVYYIYSEDHNAYVSYNNVEKNGNATVKHSTTAGDTEKWVLIRKGENETAMAIVAYTDKDITDGANRYGLNTQANATGNIVLWKTAAGNAASFYQIEKVGTQPVFNAMSGLDNFQSGWYQIKTQTGYSASEVGKYASCVSATVNGNNWIFTLEETNKNLTTLVYIDNNDNSYHIKSTTGNYAKENVTIGSSPVNLTLTTPDDDKTLIRITSGNQGWGGWLLNGTPIIGSSRNSNSTWRFNLSSADTYVSENYDVYTVVITGAPEGNTPTVTYNKEGYTGIASVFAGGTFFVEKGTTASAEDFTATEIADYSSTITISGNTITVTYDWKILETIAKIAAEIAKFGQQVGYPLTVPENVATALAAAQATPNAENLTALQTAYDAIWGSLTATDIKLPEDGKVYRIKNYIKTVSGIGQPVHYIQNNGGTAAFPTTADDETTLWICQQSAAGNNRTYVSATGDVALIWEALGESAAEFEMKKGTEFGCLQLRSISANSHLAITNEAFRSGLGFNKSGGGNAQDTNWSTDFIFEEVTEGYAGFTAGIAAGSNGNYGTLNLPFAVTLPEGVTANKVELSAENENELNVTPVELGEGNVLPAGTPVLLTAEAAGSYTFAPAAAQGTAAIETGLQGTLAAKAVTGTAYIMAFAEAAGSEIKFFLLDSADNTVNANKAYYAPAEGTAVRAFALTAGTATGIGSATTDTAGAKADCYDLSGRRVTKPARGLYIIGGKKVFVK